MTDMIFEFEWENPESARGSELRATWGRFSVYVDNEAVTRLEDKQAASIRKAVYGPLYPIAEWIVKNWWSLLNETATPRREATAPYWRRHNLAAAGEGFALPSLFFRPEGHQMRLDWRRRPAIPHRVEFLSEGNAVVDLKQAMETLSNFVTAVVTRLEQQGVADSYLSDEWLAIRSADAEERSFCKAVGQLGLDPYDLDEKASETVIRLASSLPETIWEEFFAAADPGRFKDQGADIESFLHESHQSDLDLAPFRDVRHQFQNAASIETSDLFPWNVGYEAAKTLRTILNVPPDNSISSIQAVGDLFHLPPSLWRQAITYRNGLWRYAIDAAVATSRRESPCFALGQRHERGQVFTLCRAIFEYLTGSGPPAAIVTPSHSENQKRNRAFAAEFIAPAEQIRDHISGEVATDEDIQEMADVFGTSEFVIRHQIQNHRIAAISEWTR
jgi:hypothetical protein